MKNKNVPNIIFIISMLLFTAFAVNYVIRNIPIGIWAVLIVTAANAIAITLLIITPSLKRKGWIVACRVVFIAWLIYSIYLSTQSANADATILMMIYAIAGVLAMVFGTLRHKIQNEDN